MVRLITVFRDKRGTALLSLIIIYMILFPFFLLGLQDVINIYTFSKQLKIGVDTATKSACLSMRFDEDKLASGIIEVTNTSQVEQKFYDFFRTNVLENPDAGISGNERLAYVGSYVKVYTLTPSPPAYIPAAGEIPLNITTKVVQVRATKPTVFAIVRFDYRTFLFGRTVPLIAVSASQYNISGLN